PLGVRLHLVFVEVDLAQVAAGVAFCLIVEMLRRRCAALSASADCHRADAILTELDRGDEAVAAGPVPFLRPVRRTRAEGRERSAGGGCESDGNARSGV